MKLADFKAVLEARPFRPFEMRVDGETIPVQHPEQVFLSQDKNTVIVDLPERMHILEISRISKLTLPRRRAGKSSE